MPPYQEPLPPLRAVVAEEELPAAAGATEDKMEGGEVVRAIAAHAKGFAHIVLQRQAIVHPRAMGIAIAQGVAETVTEVEGLRISGGSIGFQHRKSCPTIERKVRAQLHLMMSAKSSFPPSR